MKNYYGYFTKAATRELKNSKSIFCKVDGEKILVCNGYFMFAMTPADYETIARPVTCCDPGAWTIQDGNRSEADNSNIAKIWNDTLAAARDSDGTTLHKCPAEFFADNKKKDRAAGYYNAAAGFAAFYNVKFIECFEGLTLHAQSATGAALAMTGSGEAVAMILPIRPDATKSRMVKAYFDAEAAEDGSAAEAAAETAEKLQRSEAMREALANKITELCDEITSRNSEIDALRQQIAEQAAKLEEAKQTAEQQPAADPAEQPAPDMKTAAELIAQQLQKLAGVRAIIKGAQTSAPVVWLDGETKKHAEAIKAAGAKWSTKKSAYYIKVA